MLRVFCLSIFALLMLSCGGPEPNPKPAPTMINASSVNGLTTDRLASFQWMNETSELSLEAGSLKILTNKGSDFFNNPENGEISASAPFMFQEIQGDFVATALVQPDFKDTWNAACLMMHGDSTRWIKLAFENSDATGKSIVSVVTDGVSDDANGAVLNDQDQVWLKLIRKGDLFACHWSLDGQDYKMARLSRIEGLEMVKIGIEVQVPVGTPVIHKIHSFELEQKTVADLRKGE